MKSSYKFKINYYDCDKNGYLSLRSLVALSIEASSRQSSLLEKNINESKNNFWIVYSHNISINKLPKMNDEITITTYCSGMNRFYADREMIIENDGDVLAKILSEFLLISKIKKRPIKIPEEYKKVYGKEKSLFDKKINEKEFEKNYNKNSKLILRKSDIDINGHISNAQYFDIVRENMKRKQEEIKQAQIIYKNQILYDDEVYINYNDDDNFYFEIVKDKKILSKGRIIYV
ncbi:MAG: thioesterase [Peptoniphilaceae bacterium]|nr:thioesterase [Peptoniphilaceae bacterium]MDD7383174.1 thioesterase [Peptoniphilaceae bacterium]MDY3738398.1 thioesterase [Peptoniphilaceae bacterium]